MSSVVPTALSALERVKEYVWLITPPYRVSINFHSIFSERKYANSFAFQEMDHVRNRPLTQFPLFSESTSSGGRIIKSEVRNVDLRKIESCFNPVRDHEPHGPGCKGSIPDSSRHTGLAAKAGLDWFVQLPSAEERRRKAKCAYNLCHVFSSRLCLTLLPTNNGVLTHSDRLGKLLLIQHCTLAGDSETRWIEVHDYFLVTVMSNSGTVSSASLRLTESEGVSSLMTKMRSAKSAKNPASVSTGQDSSARTKSPSQ